MIRGETQGQEVWPGKVRQMSDDPKASSTDDFQTAEFQQRTTSIFRPIAAVQVDMAARSHLGLVRKNNEDHFFAGRWGRFMDVADTNLPEGDISGRVEEVGYTLIVADGMGGEEGGEVASRMAIRTLLKHVMQMPEWLMRSIDGQMQPLIDQTIARYQLIDATLRRHAEGHSELSRMGTTMTMAYSFGADLLVANIGDSRAYLLSEGKLRQLTRDQTLAQLLVEKGELTVEQAATHRLRHVLTQVLGGQGEQLQVDVHQIALKDGDWLLLCSDGLSDMVNDESIERLIRGSGTSSAACQSLIDEALAHGGRDNVTVVIAHYGFPGEE